MEHPKVVVLILSYNGKELLDDAVSSYLDNDYQNFEVIVIDNGSTDGTLEWMRSHYPDVYVHRTDENLKYSGGFNFGIDYAVNQMNADYFLVTNNDVKVDSKVISSLVNLAVSDPMIGFVTGKVYYFDAPDTLQTVGKYEDKLRWNGEHIGGNEKDTGKYDTVSERFFIDDIFTLVNAEMYKEIGAYDTLFAFQAEEYDWQARAKGKGYKIMYTPEAKIWHKESMTIGKESAFKAYYDARNPMLVILKHKSPAFFKRYFWNHFKKGVVRRTLVSIKKGNFDIALKTWKGFFSAMNWGRKNKKFTRRHFV